MEGEGVWGKVVGRLSWQRTLSSAYLYAASSDQLPPLREDKPRWRTTAINGPPLSVKSRRENRRSCVRSPVNNNKETCYLDLTLFTMQNVRAKHQTWLGGFAPETCQYPSMENLLENCF
ncbi:hypothetical protein TNCT_503691 [Trichonephila clavata]|uniref:Uncharacterized protein n=1 Tax=Trichonephila clavata TaxID=2740835 RepID=A0A8X6FL58_TRICU|nr:hypothetical protein TNCT_503691 [Trichonephila clavata]